LRITLESSTIKQLFMLGFPVFLRVSLTAEG